jgi:hypothetical protein
MAPRMPVLAIPHGGGPCFTLPDGTLGPPGLWTRMRAYLESISASLPAKPDAILMCAPDARSPGPHDVCCVRGARFGASIRAWCCAELCWRRLLFAFVPAL